MKKYLLDTNICIHFLKGEYNLDKKIRDIGFENCFVSEITILELLFGVENSVETKKELNRQVFKHFYKLIEQNIVLINSSFETYAIEKVRLKKIGKLIAEFDMLIGCSAIANNMIIVTRNIKHFERLSGNKTENWIDEKYIK
ncbi:MAG: PIN domain-containing protein [Bacteroidales bacterium]|nr:PIN domain-containing protein [Bacteroidales bacterium]